MYRYPSLKTLKRAKKPNSWVHYLTKKGITACGKEDIYRLFCGPRMTQKWTEVTCPRCIEVLNVTKMNLCSN